MTIKSRLARLEIETAKPETTVIFVSVIGRDPLGWQCGHIKVMRLPGESNDELNSRAIKESDIICRGRQAVVFRPVQAS